MYANTEICKHSEYGTVVGNIYIRPQVSGTGVRKVTATTLTRYHDLSEFERGVTASAQ
jgi:hypothetical protein